MKAYAIAMAGILAATTTLSLVAQQPALSSIEAPYPALQSTVHVAGATYGSGAVEYGPVGAPLVLTGSNLGTGGTVQFVGYMNGAPDGKNTTATVTMWTQTILMLSVPTGAVTGLVKVTTSGGTSNGLPFIVTPGSYAPSCPFSPNDSDFQIVTSSLQDGTVGQSYGVTLSATGGTPPYAWSLAGSALPAGLSLSSTGSISGTPTSAGGPVSLTIEAQDNNHLTTQALLNLTVDPTLHTSGLVYNYSATYDGAGNVSGYADSVMGTWGFQYDTLNRLAAGNASTGEYDGQYACWSYDSFGNRLQQEVSSAPFLSGSGGARACQPQSTATVSTDLATYSASNQIAETNARGVVATPGYDMAGNILSDGVVNYLYDAEGRVCAVAYTPMPGNTSYYGYEYDAEGNRVSKGTISTLSCDPSVSGLTYTESYVLSPGGQQLTTLDGSGHWQRTNVYGGSTLLATYDTTNLHFHLSDPLGTRRVQTDPTGVAETECESLPFGDGMTCFPVPNPPNGADDATPLHFTGKERDTESGLDYFGARYYGSSMGRFMSPDHPLIDQHPENPQSWNLYAYARNNPLINIDPTGLGCVTDLGQGSDANHESVELNNSISSDDCAGQHGTWVPGDVNKDNIGAYRGDDGSINFQATTNTGGNVYYSSFVSGAQTDSNGVGPGADISHVSSSWLSGQLVGGSLDQLMSFAANRMQPRGGGDLMALFAGPGFSLDAPDNWAGPGGMGTPQGQGDWAAMAHDYNFLTNGITIGSYFNPFISRATAKALIQSDNNLIGHAGGAQSVKMGMFFGVVNAFQWLTHPSF